MVTSKQLSASVFLFFLLILSGFASAAVSTSFEQCSNNNPTLGSCKWIGSIIQQSNSVYYEGMTVPQRILFEKVTTNGAHTISFTYQYSKAGIHAYDFLTTVNQSNDPAITLNECADMGGSAATCSALFSGGNLTQIAIPTDTYTSKDGSQASKEAAFDTDFPEGRFIKVYASTASAFTSASITSLTHNVANGADTSDSEASVTISFTSSGCGSGANECQYLVFFGGHLALTGDGSGASWGPGLGSSQISGGPYHIKNPDFDGSGGNLDNQIKGADILAPSTGTLNVVKTVVNDNGGTVVSSDFTVYVQDANGVDVSGSPAAGSSIGTSYTLDPGTFTVSEDLVSGYAQASIECGGQATDTVTLAADQNITCIITNNDIQPQLTVIKTVINDDGGTAAASDFNISVSGTNASPSNFAGNGSGTAVTLNAGAYSVSEAPVFGYSGSLSADCSGSIAIGEEKTCTITNDDIAPTLTLVKTVVNDNGGSLGVSDFDLFIDATQVSSGVANTLNAGNYTASETEAAGYTASAWGGDCDVNGNVSLGIGEDKTCTITNDDQPGKIIVTKVVVNDNGGTLQVADFNLFVGATQVSSGAENGVDAGSYVVSEDAFAGYSSAISGDCDAQGNVTVGNGETKSCTITNDDVPPTLTLVKTVINDNGGTLAVSDFNLYIDGSGVSSGQENTLNAGPYVASEDNVFGYAASSWGGDCDAQGNVTLNLGDNKTCTITNDDIQPVLTVIKTVVNDDGGTAIASDFNISVSGTNVSPSAFSGNEGGAIVALDAGAYDVNESSVFGYTGSFSADCSGSIAVGEEKTCTITNDDVAPTLTLIKVVVNDNGGTLQIADFNLYISGSPVSSGEENTLSAGDYTASEDEAFGYAASDWSGDCATDGSVSLAVGENKTCTITNDDVAPTLTLIKTVVNDNGGTLQVTDFNLYIDGSGVTSGEANTLNAGNYTASEDEAFGYAASDWGTDCAADGSVTLSVGENKTCTITNDDVAPKLTLIKEVVNDNGGTLQVADFALYIDQTQVTSGESNTLNAGNYTASEDEEFGYAASDWTGDCAVDGSVTLSVGENKTCTITNDDIAPTLTLVKTVVNDNGGTLQVSDFNLYIDAFSATSGEANTLNAGDYTASEDEAFGYAASDWSGDCAADGSVSLSVGEDKTCTITNDDVAPTLTLVKTVVNDNGGTLQVADFNLYIDGSGVVSGEANTLNAGSYTASEDEEFGYEASDWGTDCAANGSVTLSVGENKTCTITNDDIAPTLTLIKEVINDNGGTLEVTDFNLYIDDSGATSGEANTVDAGDYTASEDDAFGYSASDWTGDCAADGSVTLSVGENKTCTITNDDIQPVLTVIKHVVNDNGGSKAASDFSISVAGNNASPDAFAGDEGGTLVALDAGDYNASEQALFGYTDSYSEDCAGTISVGEEKTCTITNDDQPGKLIVTKVVVNDDGGTLEVADFNLYIDASGVVSGAENTVDAGSYVVSEDGVFGYTGSISGDCDEQGNVTVGNGETKTCTITNEDIAPKLTLIKTVVNDNGGTLQVADFNLYINGSPAVSGEENTLSAGDYTASEDEAFGYAASDWGTDCAADGTVSLSVGEEKTCTITNDDIAPTLTLVKEVINDNGGTLQVADFNLYIDASNATSGEANTLNAGSYAASEDEAFGYLASDWSGDCSADGSVTLSVGENKTCTITNDDIAPTLTLVKTVINDNGGTLQVADFNLYIDGSPVTSGEANTLNAGNFSASEDEEFGYAASDWAGDCAADGSVSLSVGENKTCTIINDDIAPTLTLVKTVINDNGGTLEVADFALYIDAAQVNSGEAETLNAGAYTASEDSQFGYAASAWGGDCDANGNVSLSVGENKTCTIMNDDIAPTLTLVKTVVNDNGGTLEVADFNLYIDGSSVTSGETNTLNAGSFTASEDEAFGYSASDWATDCAADGSVSLSVGENKTCTITNDDIAPTLTLIKEVINDNGGTLQVADFPLYIDDTQVTSGEANILNAGSYTASEDEEFGYAASDWAGDCAVDGSVSLSVGEEKTCTITNDDVAPTLTLVKTVVNDNGGTLEVADFNLYIDGSGVTSGEANTLNAGSFTASEDEAFGYAASDWGTDCASDGSVTLSVGENKTCTITNDDIAPTLTLIKEVINDNGGTLGVADFNLYIDATNVTSGEANTLNAGNYTASEDEAFGYAASDWSGDCAADGSVSLSVGEEKTCTITNDDVAPTLTLVKVVVNDNGGTLEVADFNLYISGSPVLSGESNTLNAGDYTASEDAQFGYEAFDWIGDCAADGSVSLSVGENKTCTITNDDIAPTLTLVKTVVNDNGGTLQVADFNLYIDGSGVVNGEVNTLNAGSYNASEDGAFGYAASDWGTDCTADGSVTLSVGENKVCTISNDDVQPKITVIKHVINDNGGTAAAQDFNITVDGSSNATPSAFVGDENGVLVALDAGDYNAFEAALYGYSGSYSEDCAGTISVGEEKICTITNDDIQPRLIVVKHVINDNTGTAVASDFDVNVLSNGVDVAGSPASGSELGIEYGLDAGDYAVYEAESQVEGYVLISIECDGSDDGNVSLSVGDVKTCTVVNDDIPPTRTQGFWQTHTAYTTSVFNSMGNLMLIGTGGHTITIDTIGKLFGAYYSSIPKKSDKSARNGVDKARMVLLQQLVTVKLNCAAFNCSISIQALVTSADAAYAAGNVALMNSLTSQLDAYNNSGDSIPIPGSQGKATPKDSSSLANIPFWDSP